MIFDAAVSMSLRSSGVSSTDAAPIFSSNRCSFVVPGIGTIHGFWASRQRGDACSWMVWTPQVRPSRSDTKALANSTANTAASSGNRRCEIFGLFGHRALRLWNRSAVAQTRSDCLMWERVRRSGDDPHERATHFLLAAEIRLTKASHAPHSNCPVQ